MKIEIGKVEGDKDLYIKIPFSDNDYYIYITPEGRLWGQYCKKEIVNPASDCDDGIDLTTKDVYEIIMEAMNR